MKYLGIAPARILPEAEDEIIAVSNHKFALLVNTVFGTIDDLRPARKHLRSQRVNACHAVVYADLPHYLLPSYFLTRTLLIRHPSAS